MIRSEPTPEQEKRYERCKKRGHHKYIKVTAQTNPVTGEQKFVRAFAPGMIWTHRLCTHCGRAIPRG